MWCNKSQTFINLLWEISLAKNLLTVMLVFWCIDKLPRYLPRSTCYTKMNCKPDFYTCKWQDMIQAWWDCLAMSPSVRYLLPLLSVNCLFKWQSDSLYWFYFKVDQKSPSAILLSKNDGWMVILVLGKICFVFSCNINVWIFIMSLSYCSLSK